MATEMTNENINFEKPILDRYKNTPYESLISKSFVCYGKVFNLVYEKYNMRFKKIYDIELWMLGYYFNFLDYFRNEAVEIIKEISPVVSVNELEKANVNVYLIENENEFENKAIKKGLNIGLNKNEIFEIIDILIFKDAAYFISIAEDKKYVYKNSIKYVEEGRNTIMFLKDSKGDITKTKAISKALNDPNYKSNPSLSLDKTINRFIKLNETKEKDILKIENEIRSQLRNLI